MTATTPDPAAPPARADQPATRLGPVLVAMGIGAAVSIGLGLFGRLHAPTGIAINLAGFSSGLAAKTWLTTAAFLFAIVQLVTGMAIFGRIPLHGAWLGPVHRWSGRIAVLLVTPVAVHCLYALGFQDFSSRALVHSILGCLFFGAFVCKMLVLTRDDAPGWVLPVLGGLVFSLLTALFATAAVWFFVYRGFTF
ncbi:DUF6529 family protein [Microlunatus ginsengisoli]|uniref:DUF6529 family protein n=1 Tax=Microlunatus ginsengisoli TaxID=363863 RepID=A0ABP7ACH4_9ACTN